MNILQAKTQQSIPDYVIKKLSGKPIEQQLKYFSLEYFHTVTVWIDQKVNNLEKYHGKKIGFGEENIILIQDNIIVGIDIGEKLYCFTKPYSAIHSYNGHWTSNDGWGSAEGIHMEAKGAGGKK